MNPSRTLAKRRRVGLYGRISSDPRGISRSVDQQVLDSQADIARRPDWDLVETYLDPDRSASRYARKRREQFDRMLADIRAGKLDVIVAWEASRLSRDQKVYVELAEACREFGVLLSYNGRVYDLDDPDDEFQAGLDNLLSVREAGTVRKRVMRDQRHNAQAGRPHGLIPYGYVRVYDPRSRALLEQVPDPATAPVVQSIFAELANGMSTRAVARNLNTEGIPAPAGGQWTPTSIKRVAERRSYLGVRTWNGRVMEGPNGPWHQPLIEQEQFDQVQGLLAAKRRLHAREGNRENAKHLLSGILACGDCGGRTHVAPRNSIPSYICPDGHVARAKKLVDESVVDLLLTFLAQDAQGDFTSTAEGEVKSAMVALNQLERELGELYDGVEKGEVSARMAMADERRIAKLKEAALTRLERARPTMPSYLTTGAPVTRTAWQALDLDQQRGLMRLTFTSLRVLRKKGQTVIGRRDAGVEVTWRHAPDEPELLL